MLLSVTVDVTISANHDGLDTTGYKLYVDGAVAAVKTVNDLVGGRISFKYASEVGSAHAFAIEAYRDPEMSDVKTVTIT